MDILLAVVVLILTIPFFLVTWLILFFQNRGRPFFYQPRPGKNQAIFNIIKFKTMTDKRDQNDKLLPDNQRLTLFGKYVRILSLDELPQLINVLKGDMSLIGPRPLLSIYIPLYTKDQLRRHEVRPGITGWAQVNGRNSITWTRKFELDIDYVNNISFILDCRIFWLSILRIVKAEGINQSAERSMEYFNGNN